MNKTTSAPARALAAIAVVCGFLALIVVISSSLGGDDGGDGQRGATRAQQGKAQGKGKRKPASYVVQSGDTLVSIARRTGVPVAQIERLNPGVDPQILVSGEKLKLR